MENILAAEGSGAGLLVNLFVDGADHLATSGQPYRHNEQLAPLISQLFKENRISADRLDFLACTSGPGSFTGLRVVMSTLKGMAFGAGVPLVSIPTPDLFAAPHTDRKGLVVPLVDARKSGFYAALFRESKRCGEYLDLPPEEILNLCEGEPEIVFCGPGAELFYERIRESSIPVKEGWTFSPSDSRETATNMIRLARIRHKKSGGDPPETGPFYKRRSDAEENRNIPVLPVAGQAIPTDRASP